MRQWLLDYNDRLVADSVDDDGWVLHQPELSFKIWKLWKSFDFQIPLFAGGVLEYPDWLLDDIQTLNWINGIIRRDGGYDKRK